jgi:hypothetical protein
MCENPDALVCLDSNMMVEQAFRAGAAIGRSPRGTSMEKPILWLPVPGFEDYEVSEHGDLRRGLKYYKAERVQGTDRKRFRVRKNGREFSFKAHQLVALAFIGPKPFASAEVCHKDGFHHNNHYSNLRWDTHLSNVADATEYRLKIRESLGRAKPKHYIDVEASRFIANNRRA